jgi:hypothetical protein
VRLAGACSRWPMRRGCPHPFASSGRRTGSRRPPSCRHGFVRSTGSAGAGRTRPPLRSPPARCAWLPHPSSWRRHAPRLPRPGTRPELRLAVAGPGLFMGASVTADG